MEKPEQIIMDFADQLKLAEELHGLRPDSLFRHPPRSGFLSRFIRVSSRD
jgi:hypothetical protein